MDGGAFAESGADRERERDGADLGGVRAAGFPALQLGLGALRRGGGVDDDAVGQGRDRVAQAAAGGGKRRKGRRG